MSQNNKNTDRPLRVIISGGGTGGHIFPALSIANALKRRNPDTEILFVGALGRMEMERVPKAGYRIEGLPVAGFDRSKLWRNLGVIVKLLRSMRKARRLVREFAPDVVVGVGGYASGPTLKAAQRLGIPTLIQEQNSYAGVTNKLLAAKADAICVAYEGMERFFPADKITLTGNPVRASLLECNMTKEQAKDALGFDTDTPLVFVTGGSLGARTINESVANALETWSNNGYNLMWQTGSFYADKFQPLVADMKGMKASSFVDNMDTAYRAADIVVARAGASTISELQILGIPAVLIPSPNVAEDHQRKNAEALSTRDAAVMILDNDARERLTAQVVDLLSTPQRLVDIASNVRKMALPEADEKIVNKIYSILK